MDRRLLGEYDMTPLEANQLENKEVLTEEALPGLHKHLLQYINGNVIADLGCGAGDFSNLLPKKKFHNFDCSKRSLDNFKLVDLSWDSLGDIKTDTVILCEVLEHLENPWHCVREAKRISNRIVVTVPVVDNLRNKLIYLFRSRFWYFLQPVLMDGHTQPIFRQQLDRMRGDWSLTVDTTYNTPVTGYRGAECLVQVWDKEKV